MKKVYLSRRRFSEIVWGIVMSQPNDGWKGPVVRDDLRSVAAYNTGTISNDAAWELYKITKYFKPMVVAEVGTFIGTSTTAMADGMGGGLILTCDASNDIKLDSHHSTEIKQYPKMTSTQMFYELVQKNTKLDMVYVDGRLQEQDFGLLQSLSKPHTMYLLDDFEGIEKGVANASALMNSICRDHHLIYPNKSLTAMILPKTLIEFVPQEMMQ